MTDIQKRLWFYRITSFASGMSVMAVELAASRLLGPYFSTAMPVWSVIIGFIMAAMALGNWMGGRLADKTKDDKKLFNRLLFAAAWVAVAGVFGKYVVVFVAAPLGALFGDQIIVAGSLVACTVLFGVPMVIFGMVSPFLVRTATALSPETPGKTIGSIYAMGTVGSIAGTFLSTFVTVPYIGTQMTFVLFACVLALLWVARMIVGRMAWYKGAIAAVLAFALLAIPLPANYAFWQSGIVVEDESMYNYLMVREDSRNRYFSTNVLFGVQSVLPLQDDMSGVFYFDALAPAIGFDSEYVANRPIKALSLGMGTGTFARQLQRTLPGSTCTAVEIDGKIVDLAFEWFDIDETMVNAVVGDGRAFINQDTEKYDLIVVDAYQDISLPFAMATQEFYQLCHDRLAPGGVLVLNINMNTESVQELLEVMVATLSMSFADVYEYRVEGSTNVLLYCPLRGDLDTLAANAQDTDADLRLTRVMNEIAASAKRVEYDAQVMTDDRAPVEAIASRMLASIIRQEREYIMSRAEYHGGGIKGLFKALMEG